MQRTILFILMVAAIIGCDSDHTGFDPRANMLVNYYTAECQGEGISQCLLVQEGKNMGSDLWTYFYDGIEGFTFEKGTRYDLLVQKEKIDNPPADGSSIRYTLIKILNAERVHP
jgi:hypothetical protein